MDQRVYDEDGVWLVNTGMCRFVDPLTGYFYEPGVRTKAKLNAWLESQPVIEKLEAEAKAEEPKKEEAKKEEPKK